MGIPPRLAYLVHLVRRSILKYSNIRQAVGTTTAEPPEPLGTHIRNLPEPHQTPHRNLRNLPEPARNHEPPCSVEKLKKHFIVYYSILSPLSGLVLVDTCCTILVQSGLPRIQQLSTQPQPAAAASFRPRCFHQDLPRRLLLQLGDSSPSIVCAQHPKGMGVVDMHKAPLPHRSRRFNVAGHKKNIALPIES